MPINEWKLKYVDMLWHKNNSSKPSSLIIDEAAYFKEKHQPNTLYKYRVVNSYSLDQLEKQTIWLASPDTFNDPYDSGFFLESPRKAFDSFVQMQLDQIVAEDPNTPEIFVKLIKSGASSLEAAEALLETDEKMSKDEIASLLAIIGDFMEDLTSKQKAKVESFQRKNLKVCSLSAVNDNLLMWGHYAGNHKGFCIGYAIDKLPSMCPQRRLLYPVIYQNKLPDMSIFLDGSLGGMGIFFPTLCALYKSPHWSYEEEWRFIHQFGEDKTGKHSSWSIPIRAVYLGSNISDYNKDTILTIAKNNNYDVYQMKMAQNSFELVAHQFV